MGVAKTVVYKWMLGFMPKAAKPIPMQTRLDCGI